MQTKFIIAICAAVSVLLVGAGVAIGWSLWGTVSGATEYADSDADERLGDAREDAVGRTDDAIADLGDAVDAASRSGDEITDITEIIAGEYRELGNVSDAVADGVRGDAEIAGRIADIVGDGAHRLDDRAGGDNSAAGHREDAAGPGGGEGGETRNLEPP
jgi:hypothetical protein